MRLGAGHGNSVPSMVIRAGHVRAEVPQASGVDGKSNSSEDARCKISRIGPTVVDKAILTR